MNVSSVAAALVHPVRAPGRIESGSLIEIDRTSPFPCALQQFAAANVLDSVT